MKIFSSEKGKEVVYIQYKNLRNLSNSKITPEYIKKLIPIKIHEIEYNDEYMKFDDKEFIKWIKDAYFILDFDKFSKMTKNEIYNEYDETEYKIKRILLNLNNFSKEERKNQIGFYQAYNDLCNYKNEILYFLKSKKIKLPNEKIYVYKNNAN